MSHQNCIPQVKRTRSSRNVALLEHGKNTLLHREERILVSINEAVRKTEKLSMICTLCHATASAASRSSQSWLFEKLCSVLGRQAADEFQTLVASQKSYNELLGYTGLSYGFQAANNKVVLSFPQPDGGESKGDLVQRLKERPDKRRFLQDIMMCARSSEGQVANTSKPFSVVALLKAALQSKYREHVRRCFKEMDVESLMNILYLMVMPSSSPAHSTVTNSLLYEGFPLSSLTLENQPVGDDLELYPAIESPLAESSESSKRSIFWDDEETVIGFAEDLKDETSSWQQEDQSETKALWKQHWEHRAVKITEMQEKFRNMFSISAMNQFVDLVARLHDSEPLVYFAELEVLNAYGNFSSLTSSRKLEKILLELERGKENIDSLVDKRIQNFVKVLHSFRSLVETIFASHRRKSGGIQSINKMMIELKLLLLDQNKLQEKLTGIIKNHNCLQESLTNEIEEWQRRLDEARTEIGQQLKSSIKDHVAAEISIGKSRENKLSSCKRDFVRARESLSNTTTFVKQAVKSLRARRHYLEASLESLMRAYDATMLKYQAKIDELCVEEAANNRHIEGLQNKFKVIEERYDEMRAMKRLKQLLANMEKAEAIKQNWAARKIQMAWRKYKVAKLRKKKLKGRKKGKKKTPPPPGKGTSPPAKSSTPGSRSKSQTP